MVLVWPPSVIMLALVRMSHTRHTASRPTEQRMSMVGWRSSYESLTSGIGSITIETHRIHGGQVTVIMSNDTIVLQIPAFD